MQSTISTPSAGTWHNLKVQYLALACGLAFAAAAAVGVGAFGGGAASRIDTTHDVTIGSTVRPAAITPPPLTFFVLDSQERANQLARLANEDALAISQQHGATESLLAAQYLVVDSPEQQALLTVMVNELMAIEQETGRPSPAVIDLR
jgi:hypothetical protein